LVKLGICLCPGVCGEGCLLAPGHIGGATWSAQVQNKTFWSLQSVPLLGLAWGCPICWLALHGTWLVLHLGCCALYFIVNSTSTISFVLPILAGGTSVCVGSEEQKYISCAHCFSGHLGLPPGWVSCADGFQVLLGKVRLQSTVETSTAGKLERLFFFPATRHPLLLSTSLNRASHSLAPPSD
jgi:hypothetical protein